MLSGGSETRDNSPPHVIQTLQQRPTASFLVSVSKWRSHPRAPLLVTHTAVGGDAAPSGRSALGGGSSALLVFLDVTKTVLIATLSVRTGDRRLGSWTHHGSLSCQQLPGVTRQGRLSLSAKAKQRETCAQLVSCARSGLRSLKGTATTEKLTTATTRTGRMSKRQLRPSPM